MYIVFIKLIKPLIKAALQYDGTSCAVTLQKESLQKKGYIFPIKCKKTDFSVFFKYGKKCKITV